MAQSTADHQQPDHARPTNRWTPPSCCGCRVQVGESQDDLPLLDRLLRCEKEAAHGPIADVLWDSASDAEAGQQLQQLAVQQLAAWETQLKASSRGDAADERAFEG